MSVDACALVAQVYATLLVAVAFASRWQLRARWASVLVGVAVGLVVVDLAFMLWAVVTNVPAGGLVTAWTCVAGAVLGVGTVVAIGWHVNPRTKRPPTS
jgi:hypothetical protein